MSILTPIKTLAQQIIAHIREDFDPIVYGGTFLWLAFLCTINYGFGGFDSLTKYSRSITALPGFIVFYSVPWFFVFGLQVARGRVKIDTPGFWPMVAFAMLLVAGTDWFPYHNDLIAMAPRPTKRWTSAIMWNLKSTVCWFTPMFAYWWLTDRGKHSRLYGFTTHGFDIKPYLLCLAVLVPFVSWASFQPAFLQQYPTYRPGAAEPYLGVSPWVTVIIYELIYGFDFSFVEMFFRGFLVIGLARWMGRAAVLPMIAMYCVLHFGKPLPETIGSVVGGYILGVFAYKSRSIIGGIMLHLGLAWSMELTATIQHALGR